MSSTAIPTYMSPISDSVDLRGAKFGASLLGLPLFEQGLQVASVLESVGPDGKYLYSEVGIQEPRRATKTTSIWATLIGRCHRIPGYKVVTTAQDGTRAGEKMREHMELLQANSFEELGLGELYWSNGKERIKWSNGSMIWVVAPKPGAFRSAGADAILIDEGGELDPEKGPQIISAALPLMDTKPNPQIIVAGTPGRAREGALWDILERGRAGAPRVGILDYSLRDDEVLVSFDEDGKKVLHEDVLARVHPGIGTLTTMEWMREQFGRMQVQDFEMEYGCRWPANSLTGAIDLEKWKEAKVARVPRPERVGIAFEVQMDGSCASIVYAWRVDGIAYVEVVAHRPGSSWVANAAHEASLKYRRVPLAYDQIGANLDPATALSRMKPVPTFDRLGMKDIMGAAQRIVSDIHEGRLKHFGQADLDAAVENTVWRDIAHSGRAFGARNKRISITPITAASIALWSYDRGRDRQPLTIAV